VGVGGAADLAQPDPLAGVDQRALEAGAGDGVVQPALQLAGAVVLWPRGELARPATAGQADSTRFVSATLTKVARIDCEEADPGVAGSICIKVTARLAGGRQVNFDTTDPTGGCSEPASGSAWP
jgi:hypothetical protein